jgi:molybdopterin-containing oxidoreductase family iron-sulfur binding subunit
MHWIGSNASGKEYPEVKMTSPQPMLCQQCGMRPVSRYARRSAVHGDAQALNLQVYNRCVGTRLREQLPYQVRAFNWRDWERPEPLPNQFNLM